MTKQTKWKLATATFGLPFIFATIAMFNDYSSFEQWSDFIRWQTPIVLALYATTDVLHKALIAKLGGTAGTKDDRKA